jgi:hypothetical protein
MQHLDPTKSKEFQKLKKCLVNKGPKKVAEALELYANPSQLTTKIIVFKDPAATLSNIKSLETKLKNIKLSKKDMQECLTTCQDEYIAFVLSQQQVIVKLLNEMKSLFKNRQR